MPKLIDVVCNNDNTETAVQGSKTLIEKHLVVVSYLISGKIFTSENNKISENSTNLLILKSKDIVFQKKLLPQLKTIGFESSKVIPIVDVVQDYRGWIEEEVHE